MFQPFNLFSCFVLVNPVVIWNTNFDFELYSQAGTLNDLIFGVLLMISLSEHTFLGTLDHKNEFSFLVTSTFEKVKLLVSIFFFNFVENSW
ncbi:hypothetical protein [Spiroplasma endosymbiont of Clivina fossor]|uniref:hypothetical protein n=1 Tax=Spiroplasma endosymbiont of Clivina fossor TaxID=3066282 RepID=UPI00313E68C3